jgi:hypothetical protein
MHVLCCAEATIVAKAGSPQNVEHMPNAIRYIVVHQSIKNGSEKYLLN